MLLKVEGISDQIGEDKLNEVFSKIGVVESVVVIRDIYSGKSKGFGFVQMPGQAEGEEAIRHLNAVVVGGLQISVKAPKHQRLLQGEMEFKEWFTDNASEVLRRLGLKEGMTILDYGCGPGRFTIPCAKIVGRNGKVYAADASPSALGLLKKEGKDKGLENIETVLCGDSDVTMALHDQSADVILVYDVMHEIGDKTGLLKELYRILKQDGFLSIFPMHMGTEKMLGMIDKCDSFAFRDRYGPFGYKTESEILNFKKVTRSF